MSDDASPTDGVLVPVCPGCGRSLEVIGPTRRRCQSCRADYGDHLGFLLPLGPSADDRDVPIAGAP